MDYSRRKNAKNSSNYTRPEMKIQLLIVNDGGAEFTYSVWFMKNGI